MNITKNVYEKVQGGFAYEILCDGVCAARQEFHPALPGFVDMTEQEANEQADAAMTLYQGV